MQELPAEGGGLVFAVTTPTIETRCRLVRRFQQFSGEFPWQWRPADIEDFLAERRSGDKPISLTTLRPGSNSVAMFCAYLTHPAYGWTDFCERTFSDIPSQICFEWNTPEAHDRRRCQLDGAHSHKEGAAATLRPP